MFRRKPKGRSPWFQGLLDREASCAIEPCDWEDEFSPGYWRQYRKGVGDYDVHIGLLKTAKMIKESV